MATALVSVANPINPRKAQSIALEYLVPGHQMSLVATAKRNPAKAATLNAEVAGTQPYYVFSRGAGLGYVVVSGDDCLPEVLGYTDYGDFDADNLPPALKDMLDGYASAIEDAQMNGTNISSTTNEAKRRATTTRHNIEPFVTSHWHQSGPYNDICPSRVDNGAKAMTGCVATAASQILYYWRKDLPSTLQSTTPTYNYGNAHPSVSFPKGTPVKWDLMCDSYSNEPAEYKQAVAEFVYCVGTATWLTYADGSGTATSGNIEKIPATFSEFFGMNGGWVAYRNSYNQEAWTQLLYDELVKGRPVMYTGVNPNDGGHAVFVHGYQASSNKFYFNFGWGGQGDGYWTTTLEDGMHGFNEYQSALIGAFPKKWNMSAEIGVPAHVYVNQDNDFRITIENNSTLDFSGLYIFAATSKTKPTDISKAKSSDESTVIKTGEKGIITLSAKPTSTKTWYITVTDENLNVLAQQEVEAESADAKLVGSHMFVYGSAESNVVAGKQYAKIYNNKAMIEVYVKNTSNVAFGGTAKLDLYESLDNGETFSFVKTISKANSIVAANTTSAVTFSATSLLEDRLYYVELNKEWGTTNNITEIDKDTYNPRAYFYSAGAADLTSKLQDGTVTFTGHWDASQYSSIVTRTTNKTATAYDLTAVESMSELPLVDYPSPNALVYGSVGANGKNVIVMGHFAGDVELTAGYDFSPKVELDLLAYHNMQININQEPNRWYMLTVPFAVAVPNGVIAREVLSHKTTTSGINNSTENVKVLQAGHTYLVMTSSTEKQILSYPWGEAETAEVAVAPSQNTDPAFVGTFSATTVPAGAKLIKDKDDKQFFMTAADNAVAEGLRGYFFDEKMPSSTTDFRAYSSATLDPSYVLLGQHIQQLYDAQKTYGGVVTAAANKAMADSIAHAEQIFSEQSIEASLSVKKYYTALEAWVEDYKTMIGNVGNSEVDMTSLIANASFEEGTVAKGWTMEKSVDVKVRQNSNLVYKTVYGDGESYLYNAAGSKVSQEVSGLTPGYYRLTAMVGSDEGNAITVFAGDSTTTVQAHSFGKHYLAKAVINNVMVGADGKLAIGVQSDAWYNADHFTLTFIGNSAETAIGMIEAEEHNEGKQGIYTLSGTKVAKPAQNGIYIINGKKTYLK